MNKTVWGLLIAAILLIFITLLWIGHMSGRMDQLQEDVNWMRTTLSEVSQLTLDSRWNISEIKRKLATKEPTMFVRFDPSNNLACGDIAISGVEVFGKEQYPLAPWRYTEEMRSAHWEIDSLVIRLQKGP